jgi:hypothetical protein
VKSITLREFNALVDLAATIITSHRDGLPSIQLTKEQARAAGAAVINGGRLTVQTYYMTTQPAISLGAEDGRLVVV